ncbi:MAG: phosphoribosylformylglycinamidine synthase subunit PurL [Elusimicrobia bacterium]|nr:phosphoribosylformylglycinamidine synthase subunit PurL [Elusimicrobiota bacterium]
MSADFLSLSPEALVALSKARGLSLNAEEMTAIQAHFKTQGRPPSDPELETLAQTWSEHCKHKTFRAAVRHIEKDENGVERGRNYKDLLKDTIVKVTEDLNKPWCLSVFKDNAGIVDASTDGGEDALAFKVETHNHPSALEPYGGAGTGLGGVIRDILGAGLGAKPIANSDVFCFGPLDEQAEKKTGSGLSTRRIVNGVVSGVRDYGNRMGIPTVSGAVVFDADFAENPLVFCGTLGLMPKSTIEKSVKPGDKIVMAGGRVGRDGIHGATFSSDTLTTGIPSSVVQIGNPIVQKKMMDVLLVARDKGLYRGITDCGAGGLSSAVGEMGEKTGALVNLEKVPLKYAGIVPWEIWLSESQERMVMAVPPGNLAPLLRLFADEDVDCAEIGTFASDGRLKVMHGKDTLVDMDMAFLHDGVPKRSMESRWSPPPAVAFPKGAPVPKALLAVLAQPTVASKEWVVRQYDHEVQGRTVVKPFVGPTGVGPSDAAVLQLHPRERRGVALAAGLNPHYSRWDAYWMAAAAIDEAVRNLIAVGARPDRIAILDNFCGGNPWRPEILGELVRTAQACHDIAKVYGTPFISGKDSLFNEFEVEGHRRAIPTTLLISALSLVDDVAQTVTMDFKTPGNWIYAVGETRDEMGGSRYGIHLGTKGGTVPRLEPEATWPVYEKLSAAIQAGWVASCHDCSEGGLGVALAEMCFGGGRGARVDLRKLPMAADLRAEGRTDKAFFSESNGRFLVEVAPRARRAFLSAMKGAPLAAIGQVSGAADLRVVGLDGKTAAWPLPALEKAWRSGGPA